MKKGVLVFSAVLAVALATAAASWAQDEKPPNLIRSYAITVKAGMSGAFEAAVREHMELLKAEGDPWTWNVYQVVDGVGLGTYYFRSEPVRWADIDAYLARDWTKADKHFSEALTPLIESVESTTETIEFGMSNWPEEDPGFKLFMVYKYYIKPSKMMDFYTAAGEFHGAMMQVGWGEYYSWIMVMTGKKGPVAGLVLPAMNWADFEEPEKSMMEVLNEALGEQGAMDLIAKFYGSFHHYDSFIARYRPELSLLQEK